MNTSTFWALVGGLTVTSVLGAVFGYQCCKLHGLNKELDKPYKFRDLYEDNAPKDEDDVYPY